MIGPVALPATAATAVAIAATETIGGIWGPILAAAAACAALTVIAKFLHLPEVWKDFRDFLHDWKGEPERDGYEGRPSFPARLTRVEQRITDHRRRNEQTAAALQAAVDALGQDRLIVETARAVLTELGHDGDLPAKGDG